MKIYLFVRNYGDDTIGIKCIKPLVVENSGIKLGKGIRDWTIYRNAITSYDKIGTHRFGDEQFDILDVFNSENDYSISGLKGESENAFFIESNYFTILKSVSEENSILTGFITVNRQFSTISLTCSKDEKEFISLEASCLLDEKSLMPKEAIASEELLIHLGESFSALEDYSRMTAFYGNVKTIRNVPTGWCSWYFYYESAEEKDVLDNLNYIYENNIPVEYIQVDMGWEQRLGDWYPSYKYPHGMKWICDRIHEYGNKAGLWLAPFWVEPRSEVHREHPEWLLKDKKGQLLKFRCLIDGYIIDPTVPEAFDWIVKTISRVVNEWGFDYIKVDFLRAVAMYPEAQFAKNVTRAEALRKGMEAIRKGAGPNTFILGCGGHYGPTLGIADGNRTSDDISANWNTFKTVFKQNIMKFWQNGKWWVNDPDCILLRSSQEGIPGCVAGFGKIQPGAFNDIEVQTILTLLHMTGGMIFLGDNLAVLNEKKLEMARNILPPTGRAAVPRDFFDSRYPHILDDIDEKGNHEICIINWEDSQSTFSFRLSELIGIDHASCLYRVIEKQGNRDMGVLMADDIVDLEGIEPHGCRVLLVFAVE